MAFAIATFVLSADTLNFCLYNCHHPFIAHIYVYAMRTQVSLHWESWWRYKPCKRPRLEEYCIWWSVNVRVMATNNVSLEALFSKGALILDDSLCMRLLLKLVRPLLCLYRQWIWQLQYMGAMGSMLWQYTQLGDVSFINAWLINSLVTSSTSILQVPRLVQSWLDHIFLNDNETIQMLVNWYMFFAKIWVGKPWEQY